MTQDQSPAELPPLPEPFFRTSTTGGAFDMQQMHAYARAAVDQAKASETAPGAADRSEGLRLAKAFDTGAWDSHDIIDAVKVLYRLAAAPTPAAPAPCTLRAGLDCVSNLCDGTARNCRRFSNDTAAAPASEQITAGDGAKLAEFEALLHACRAARRFIRNGIEFGAIRMPDADCPDPAHDTPGLLDAAIARAEAIAAAPTKPAGATFEQIREGIATAIENGPHIELWTPAIADLIRSIGPTPTAAPLPASSGAPVEPGEQA